MDSYYYRFLSATKTRNRTGIFIWLAIGLMRLLVSIVSYQPPISWMCVSPRTHHP